MPKKKTLEEFISDCNKKFNNKFDYSKIENYNNQQSEIVIICPTHGEVQTKAKTHYESEYGCRDCFQESQKKDKIFKSCEYCGEQMDITLSRESKKRYCSYECMGKAKDNKIENICMVCHKPYLIIQSRKDTSMCCSRECSDEYSRAKQLADHVETRIINYCKVCEKQIITKPSENQVYCSLECRNIGETGKYTMENNPNFKRVKTECDYCKEPIFVKSHKFEIQKHNFCSNKCKNAHLKEIYSKTDEFREKRSMSTLKALSEGKFKKTDNEIQRAVNGMLENLNIPYENEYIIFKYAIDNYIIDKNLAIEVMGTFWHQDIRFNKEIIYNARVNNIRKDRAKRTYLNNKGIYVLYLWEYDINNNPNLCKEMIERFYKNNGIIDNYHSFNYNSNEIIIPYMEMKNEEFQNYVHLDVKKVRAKRDDSKWIKFNCDFCGNPKEQLISKYNKNNTHCCSISCSSKLLNKNKNTLKKTVC